MVHSCRVEWKKIAARFNLWKNHCTSIDECKEPTHIKESELSEAVNLLRASAQQVNDLTLEESVAAEKWRQIRARVKVYIWYIVQARVRGNSVQILDRKSESQFHDFSHLPRQVAEDIFQCISKNKNIDSSTLAQYDYAIEMSNVKAFMRQSGDIMKETFKFYCVGNTSASASIGMSLDEFMALVSGCKIINYVTNEDVKKVFGVVCRSFPSSILLKPSDQTEIVIKSKLEFPMNSFLEALLWLSCFLKNDVGERSPGHVLAFQINYIVSNFVETFGCRSKAQHFREFTNTKTIKVRIIQHQPREKNELDITFSFCRYRIFSKSMVSIYKVFSKSHREMT